METGGNSHFSLRSRLRSFSYAWNGLRLLVSGQHNARIHCIAAGVVVGFGFWFRLSQGEWLAMIVVIVLVVAAEAFNSAIEALCDKVSPQRDPLIKKAKDMAAGAVLLTAIGAAAVGTIVFVPKIIALFC